MKHHVLVRLTAQDFVELLTEACPNARVVVDAHLRDYDDEVLLHLLVADIRRFAIERFEIHDITTLKQCLDVVATGLIDGDDDVENAVAVCFVEDTGWWDPEMKPFMDAWPSPLVAEAKRQREWRPPS